MGFLHPRRIPHIPISPFPQSPAPQIVVVQLFILVIMVSDHTALFKRMIKVAGYKSREENCTERRQKLYSNNMRRA